MSRAPRRQFLAPFILTAAAALPGCKHGGGGTTIIDHENPPASHYRTWTVWASDDGCEASDNASNDCPPDMSCNPPPPMVVACPEGMTGDQVTIVQDAEGGPCALDSGAEVACPEEMATEDDEEIPEELPED